MHNIPCNKPENSTLGHHDKFMTGTFNSTNILIHVFFPEISREEYSLAFNQAQMSKNI